MKSPRLFLAFACLAASTVAVSAATPGLPVSDRVVLELTFDEAALPGLTLRGADGSPANLLTPPGGGIGANPRGRAFDNTASVTMGGTNPRPGEGGRAHLMRGSEFLQDARSFTIQGWYRSAPGRAPSNYARLVSTSRVSLHFDNNEGRGLALSLNRSSYLCNDGAFRHADRWIFFAVTYNADATTDHLSFYTGGENEPVRLVARAPLSAGPVGSQQSDHPLVLGNTSEGNRPFAGLIDNVRIWADRAGGSAVLNTEALEQVRRLDLR